MPTNSNYDSYFTGIRDVPIFTYGMITITTGVLAYMTYMDPYIPEEAAEHILKATSMDGVVESNMMDTTVPEEEQSPQEEEQSPQEEEQPPQEEEHSPQEEEQPPQEEEHSPQEEEQPPQEEISETEPIEEEQIVKEEPEAIKGGKRKKRTTRRSRPSEKKH